MSKPYQKKSGPASQKPKRSSKLGPRPIERTVPIDDAENCECCQAIRRFAELCPEHVLEEMSEDIQWLAAEIRKFLDSRTPSVPLMDAALFVAWRMTRNADVQAAMDHWAETLREFVYFQDYFQEDGPSDDQAVPPKEETN